MTTQTEIDQHIEEPKKSAGWLKLLADAEKNLSEWQDKADNIDKMYANLSRLAGIRRDREFQLFWANVQVLGPSVYSKSPIPVVIPRFKDRLPLNKQASELLERCSVVTLELADVHSTMKALRDDIITVARGVSWVRLGLDRNKSKKIFTDYLHRRDFRHDPARDWSEVDWVARCGWLTKEEFKKRFPKIEIGTVAFAIPDKKSSTEIEGAEIKAGVWEIWSKSQNIVVWVTEGIENVLDSNKPHLILHDFFPCPRPAYATLERGTLKPVPDFLMYKDQLEEINEITARIGALTESLRLRGFYPAGAGEISDAIETAVKNQSDNQILVPISNWSMLGGAGAKDTIVWLPLDMVSKVITDLIALRKQLIDDVYQITGLSDIMRGSTVASETLGAQQLKSQYGSVRIKDRQEELVRVARDIVRIVCEILSENFDAAELLAMSQLQIPSDADIQSQIVPMMQEMQNVGLQMQQAQSDPQIMAMAQQNPDQAKQVIDQAQQHMQQLQGQIAKIEETVTIEKVMAFIKNDRIRSFTLDIETDSTIEADENAQKQRATEYLTAMSSLLQQAVPAITATPKIGPLISDMIKFANSQFRVGRAMEQTVEEFTDGLKQMAAQPKADPNAAAMEQQAKIIEAKTNAEIEALNKKTEADIAATKAKLDADLALKNQAATQGHDVHAKTLEANAQLHQQKLDLIAHDKQQKLIDAENKKAMHEQSMSAATQSHSNSIDAERQKVGLPPANAMDAIVAEIKADREEDTKVFQTLIEGQDKMTQAIAMLAAVNSAPKVITAPDGRVFKSETRVN
jgi:hypothetical protein